MNKRVFTMAFSAAALVSSFASNAALITLGGVNAGDSSGLTSQFIDPLNAPGASAIYGYNGYFIETFDYATAMAGIPGSVAYNHPTNNAGCSINSLSSGVTVTQLTGTFQVARGNNNYAAAPLGDNTCFGYTPAQGGSQGSIAIDYSALLALTNNTISYFGFYWGSVDAYNSFAFYNGNTLIDSFSGPELLALTGGISGNQNQQESNRYVNINFGPGEGFTKVVVTSNGVAGEFDNIAIGLTNRQVPEPAGLAILGFGLAGLVLRQRAKKS
ncbi:MAG: PEP-CTERM sorting domain-containing protein [Gammaproteobacteria bacterium]|jgi:hypothetical protein|nr:PEP-CTERM sorting domain-containing protein [Gammaproteobacteria bacterium]MBU2180715.1 PEP-CTERM sorting domain-containing protein [Gammaproteobacteria bacterium]MBU2225946.1 PEP-CTERM sorting domain-containing protein [Gammaproteobacteria bacterium]